MYLDAKKKHPLIVKRRNEGGKEVDQSHKLKKRSEKEGIN